jgi:hypothetical protein
MVAALASEPHGSFDRAVAASDEQDLFIDVVVGLDQPLHHAWATLLLLHQVCGVRPLCRGPGLLHASDIDSCLSRPSPGLYMKKRPVNRRAF